MDPIIQRIKAAGHLLVASHAEPDGDAVGSLLALGLALEKLGKHTTLFNASVIPAVYQFLPGVMRITRRMPAPESCDAAIVLDCGDLSRVGPDWPQVARIPVIMLTTESQSAKIREGRDLGVQAWIVKPFQAEKLVDAVRRVDAAATA